MTSLQDNNQTLTLQFSIAPSTTNPPPPKPNCLNHHTQPPPPPPPPYEPSLTLSLSGARLERIEVEEPPRSATTSAENGFVVLVKREHENVSLEDVEVDNGGGAGCNNYYSLSRGSDDDDDGVGPTITDGGGSTRKKLRLTKDQSALLEESFKLHNTLNPKQKQALADKLNLRSRQVEVWFQNRRARYN